MKPSILLLALFVIAFSSCTTAYKSGQTPDDVYFSPTRPEEEDEDNVKKDNRDETTYRDNDENYDDYYLRMKVRNRYRWNELDDPYYYRRTYGYNVYSCCYCKNSWTPFTYWNYYYNPYYKNNVINPRSTVYTAPRKVNLSVYDPQFNILNTKNYTSPRNYTGQDNKNVYTSPRNSNKSNDNSGNILRSIFGSGNNKNSSSGSSNSSSSSSGNSSSSSGSGSSAPVRKF